MGSLALAGSLSGLGHGLERGLFNLQQGIIQSGIQGERDEMEQRRLALTFAHDTDVQQGKQAFEAGQNVMKEQGAERRQGQEFTHRETVSGQEIAARNAAAEREFEQRKQYHTEDTGLKRDELAEKKAERGEERRVKEAELGMKKSYYDVLMKNAENRGKAAPADYKRFEIMERFFSDQAAVIREQLKDPLLDPTEKERLHEELQALDSDLRGMMGIQQRSRPKGAGIIDPFKGGPRP